MKIIENSHDHFILISDIWWPPIVGILVAGFCFWSAASRMEGYSFIHRFGVVMAGLVFLGITTLAIRKIKINFDRISGTITRTTSPLLPIGHIHLFLPRSESWPIDIFRFAFLERQLSHSGISPMTFCLALATGEIPEDRLIGELGFMNSPDRDKIRWLVGDKVQMKQANAIKIVHAINQWLGTTAPSEIDFRRF